MSRELERVRDAIGEATAGLEPAVCIAGNHAGGSGQDRSCKACVPSRVRQKSPRAEGYNEQKDSRAEEVRRACAAVVERELLLSLPGQRGWPALPLKRSTPVREVHRPGAAPRTPPSFLSPPLVRVQRVIAPQMVRLRVAGGRRPRRCAPCCGGGRDHCTGMGSARGTARSVSSLRHIRCSSARPIHTARQLSLHTAGPCCLSFPLQHLSLAHARSCSHGFVRPLDRNSHKRHARGRMLALGAESMPDGRRKVCQTSAGRTYESMTSSFYP